MSTLPATRARRRKSLLRKGLQTPSLQEGIGLILMLALIIVVMTSLSPYFLTANNLLNLLLAMSTIGIIAMFTTMLMVGGGLDLSVGSTVALVGVVISHLQARLGVPGAVAAGLTVAALIGFMNGIAVTRVGINPFIATMGMLSVARGLAFVFSGGLTEPMLDEAFGKLGRGFLAGVPVPVVFLILLTIATYIVMRHSTYGRAMYAIGGNREASHLAGLPVKRYQLIAYTLSGLSAGVASVFLTSQLAAGAPQAAFGLELSVIGAAILGGTSLTGGKGSILGTVIGVLILGTLNNGMVLLSLSSYYQQVAQGLVLLLAVGLDQLRVGSLLRSSKSRSYRIGFANLHEDIALCSDMRNGLEQAALQAGDFSLFLLDNRADGQVALANVDRFVAEKVDLVVEYQPDERAAGQVVTRLREAGIPVIAVDNPVPGAVYLGVDNHRAGRAAGEALGAWVQERWGGHADDLLVLERPGAGRGPAARLEGQREGLAAEIGPLPGEKVCVIACGYDPAATRACVAQALRSLPTGRRIAVLAVDDEAALAAVQAARESGRTGDIATVGQGASRPAREELRSGDSPLIGTIMHAPDQYGELLLQTARRILRGDNVPAQVHVEHVLISRTNVDQYYPD